MPGNLYLQNKTARSNLSESFERSDPRFRRINGLLGNARSRGGWSNQNGEHRASPGTARLFPKVIVYTKRGQGGPGAEFPWLWEVAAARFT